MFINSKNGQSIKRIFKNALLIGWAFFFFLSIQAQNKPGSSFRFEIGLFSSWHPFRTPAYPQGRLNLKLHDTPSPELYFLAGIPIGQKGFGLELTASAGLLFLRESFTIDSVYVNGAWTNDRFRQNPFGTTFYGRFALQGFWQKRIKNLPLLAGVSAGIGTSLYMSSKFSSLGVDYQFSENPVDLTIIHEAQINHPNSTPHLFIPFTFRLSYLFKNNNMLNLSLRGGFSYQNMMNTRYVYKRASHHYETGSATIRDISIGLGLGYSFASKRSSLKK